MTRRKRPWGSKILKTVRTGGSASECIVSVPRCSNSKPRTTIIEVEVVGSNLARDSFLQMLQGLAWVGNWLTFCTWSNGRIPL